MLATILIAGALGACFGSFLGVVVHRLPRAGSVVQPPSRCEDCGVLLRWFDNLPLLSWLLLRGRCRCCGARIGIGALLMEVLTAALTILAALWCLLPAWQVGGIGQIGGQMLSQELPTVGPILSLAALLTLLYYLWASTLIDLAHMIIPDELVKPMQLLAPFLALALVPLDSGSFYGWPVWDWFVSDRSVTVFAGAQHLLGWYLAMSALLLLSLPLAKWVYSRYVPSDQTWQPDDHRAFRFGVYVFVLALLPAMVAVLVIGLRDPSPWSLWLGLGLSRAILGALMGWMVPYVIGLLGTIAFKRNAMGYGDVKFLAPIGAVVGPIGVLYTIFGAAMLGTLIGVPLRLLGKGPEIPFGPYLAAGALFTMSLGPWLHAFVAGTLFSG